MVFEAVDATPLDALDEMARCDDSKAERAAAPEHEYEYEYEDEDDWEVASTASIGSTASYRSHLSAATVDEVSLVPFRFVWLLFVVTTHCIKSIGCLNQSPSL